MNNTTTFEIGEQFEKFVENELFTKKDYDLIHRTNSFKQNENRYAEDTSKPDFKFRCKKTFKEFYIEAKFRSKFNLDDRIEIMNFDQKERFKKIQETEGIPIYIAVGYLGQPSAPNKLSLIPLSELKYLKLYPTFLRQFAINKSSVDSNVLNLWKYEQPKNRPLNEEKNALNIPSARSNKKTILISGAIFSLCIIMLIGYTFFNNGNIEKELKRKTSEYYLTIDSGNLSELDNYINPFVDKWYSKTNISLSEIKRDALNHLKKYPNRKTEIQWNSFEINPLNDDYSVSYKMIYKILSTEAAKHKIFHLQIKAIWDENLKLKSIYETKI